MAIERLKAVLRPPETPLEVPNESDWMRAERVLTRLPSDYREFLEAYGTGAIDQFLWVYNPASQNEYLNVIRQAERVLGALKETTEAFPSRFPMKRFPDRGGFLPCAITDNGDSVFWVTTGEADEWTIAVMGPRAPEVYSHHGGLVEFLYDVLTRRVVCDRFPLDFPSDDGPAFTSMTG